MSSRTVIFVNGQNFRHNLRDFKFMSDPPHPHHNEYRLDEKHFKWESFFKDSLAKFDEVVGEKHELVRVYWYYAQNISSWSSNTYRANQIVDRYAEQFPELTTDMIIRKARDWYDQESRRFRQLRHSVFDEIQRNSNMLEFRYVGNYVLAPFTPHRVYYNNEGDLQYQGTQIGEKGVEIGMAIDVVSKMNKFDTAVIVAGDNDFNPAIQYLKDNLKHVYHFSVGRGVGKNARYFSSSMRNIVDCYQGFDELELLENYIDTNSNIPPAILEVITTKIEDLKYMKENEAILDNSTESDSEYYADGIENIDDDYN